MKRIIGIAAIVAFVIPCMAGFGFAGEQVSFPSGDLQTDGSIPACTVSLSKNVTLGYAADAAGTEYAVQSRHLSGDKDYGTASDSTLIYWYDNGEATTAIGIPGGTDSSVFDNVTGWYSM